VFAAEAAVQEHGPRHERHELDLEGGYGTEQETKQTIRQPLNHQWQVGIGLTSSGCILT
jgi:hypothetical protein